MNADAKEGITTIIDSLQIYLPRASMSTSLYTNTSVAVASGVWHYLAGSLFFDLIHWQAHRSHRSRFRLLRMLGQAHTAHHRYFDRKLKFNKEFIHANLVSHMPLELFCQAIGSTLSWAFFCYLYGQAVHTLTVVLAIQFMRTVVVAWNLGHDSNHLSYPKLPKDQHSLIVGPQYHALHHIDPQNYFGSMVRIVDWALGTASTLRGRRVTMTGSNGALGKAFCRQLQREVSCIKTLRYGADWSYDDYSSVESILAKTDILILAHGSKIADCLEANCNSAATLIELFTRARTRSGPELIPEVWYIGSEAEFHGSWTSSMKSYTDSKRAFAQHARAFYSDDGILYRHIVPAAFHSNMGAAVVSADWIAKVALWWIRRGAQYVPATYTGFAFLNYFRFMYWVKPTQGTSAGSAAEQ